MSTRASILRWILPLTGILVAGCFNAKPQTSRDCLEKGLCQCMQKSDCDAGLDCIDGFCAVWHPDGGGAFAAPCDAGADCASGWCLPNGPGNGGVCTETCDAGVACPRSWECLATFDAGAALCSPPFHSLCLSCAKDSDCNAVGDRCLPLDGAFGCGRDCSEEPCPAGYLCAPGDAGVYANQCVPEGGTCRCTDLSVGLTRACSNANDAGTCFGREACLPSGAWTACDARIPTPEVCDGIDNDCNGLIDGNDPGLDTSSLPSDPAYPACRIGPAGSSCLGTWSCEPLDGGPYGFACNAPAPSPEVCDYRDNDCDGASDEPFKNDAGQYVDVHDCGSCGYDCDLAIQNLAGDGGAPDAAACLIRNGQPTCVPLLCARGYERYPEAAPQLCLPAASASCRPCTADSDCASSFDRCVPIGQDPGTFCAQSCDPQAPYGGCSGRVGAQDCCLSGYTCSSVSGALLCLPNANTCTCDPSRSGLIRGCFADAGASVCAGLETCGDAGDWGVCDPHQTNYEICDYKDNDCDGVADEPFINTRDSGTYDTDEHCGSCENNCKSEWSPSIQHAIGGCDAGPGIVPTCDIAACTIESVPGGGACRVDSDCGAGRFCFAPFYQCARMCSTSADCGGSPCLGGLCAQTCTSDNQCTAALGAPSQCDAGTCSVLYQWVNADQDPSNGCECPAAAGAVDTPDLYPAYPDAGVPYVDRNCDLVDGTVATSLFVWSGSTQSLGTLQHPYRTIGEAVAAFDPKIHTAILVAEGSYVEQVVLRDRVQLYGGYSPDFHQRDVVVHPTIIEGPEPDFTGSFRRGTVNAVNITAPTVLAGFVIRGYDVTFRPAAGTGGESSYGIYLRNSTSALVIANNHVIGGRGGDASPGRAGASGANGGPGGGGRDSTECKTESCAGESQDGGAPGVNAACAGANGDPGAFSSGDLDPQPYFSGFNGDGIGGANGTYQHIDPSQDNLCKYDCIIPANGLNGGPASDGLAGAALASGPGCSNGLGQISGDDWVGAVAGDGVAGTVGRGGGGGGAGGCVINTNPPGCTIGNLVGDLGATGGGGGAGGCGGQGGTHGGTGGGSFAIFVLSGSATGSLPSISGNLIDTGTGGFGGNGSAGGYGGVGGEGGAAGLEVDPAWCAGNGGQGGHGGSGGAGSGGGGGCGGVAFGVAGTSLGATNYATANEFNALPANAAGSPGAGGASPAGPSHAGGTGQPGTAAMFHSF